jgi:ESCRT-II complex subunit VPS36
MKQQAPTMVAPAEQPGRVYQGLAAIQRRKEE